MALTMVVDTQRPVLLVVGDDGHDWERVAAHLAASSWPVELIDAADLDGAGGIEDLLPPLDGVGAAVIMLGPDNTAGLDLNRRLGLLRQVIAYLQGRLGPSRVLGLVALSELGRLDGSGLAPVAYGAGGPDEVQLTAVRAQLSEVLTPPVPGPGSWLSRQFKAVPAEIWLFLSPLLALAALLAVAVLALLLWRSGSDGGDQRVTIQLGSEVLSGPQLSAQTSDPGPITAGGDPVLESLPIRCVVDTSAHGVALPDRIACEGAGALRVDGFAGPWHNEISEVALDPGVVGSVTMEARPGAAGVVVELEPGSAVSLAPYDPAYGIDRLELLFAAAGHRVILRQAPGRGGAQAVLTFLPEG